ncbi:type II secretion system GspH family protein [Jeotgalibaca sp. MA1X17-3]|uniref:type II secretion system protein n=1 Tax=Jeotgalibaca sp. MA1X17-3 TaxID=2908211 RepID=UPI001F42315E|nr:type II secretion system protein [Jeotgalibaca sp. MA1X17-3]UJF14664.1 type II secretion system GspH family protein [Jeotgalibaca sp. MA1X17-3]
MKKLKYEKGSILLESIVALSIISLVILTFFPFQTNMRQLLLERKNEVEFWRFAQDYVRQEIVVKEPTNFGQRISDGNQLVASWKGNVHSLTITNYNQEVITIEYLSSD